MHEHRIDNVFIGVALFSDFLECWLFSDNLLEGAINITSLPSHLILVTTRRKYKCIHRNDIRHELYQ